MENTVTDTAVGGKIRDGTVRKDERRSRSTTNTEAGTTDKKRDRQRSLGREEE